MLDIVTIGSATIDVFMQGGDLNTSATRGKQGGLNFTVPFGSKIEVDSLLQETGGGATNAAFTFSLMGLSTGVIAAIGDDHNGKIIENELGRQDIETHLLHTIPNVHTGYSAIMLSKSGERSILVYRGASGKLKAPNINWERAKAKWYYVSSLGGNLTVMRNTLTNAKRFGSKVAWNPGGKEIAYGFEKLRPLIKKTDILILNREEAAKLAGTKPNDLRKIVKKLRQYPKYALIITDGSEGAYVFSETSSLHAPSVASKMVNTTGAGDAFGSGFVSGIIMEDDLEFAIGLGSCNGASVITQTGAKRGLLTKCPSLPHIKKLKIHPWK